ncbi:MAG: hypothetical protein WCT01_04035 [Candidatus Shapirobacteria bacterium]
MNKRSNVEVLVIQGMADLPDFANKMMAKILGANLYDPEWLEKGRSLEKMLLELDELITKDVGKGKRVALVGISAGAGLAMVYLSKHPNKICHIYSVGGVLNPIPNSKEEKFSDLMRDSASFAQMAVYLQQWYAEPGIVEMFNLREKVTAYVSGQDGGDGILPEAVLKPDWVKLYEVGEGDHVESIVEVLMGEIREKIKKLTD